MDFANASAAEFTPSPDICKKGGKGFVLPLLEDEAEWSGFVRACVYGFLLLYCFLGVSIVAEIFMGAIEVITSRRAQVTLSTGRVITVRIWNDTVANLTLMALGSSAPEILLAVTELMTRRMFSGELGPATIVGSASFNLLMIVALCVVVIPSPETRRVKEMPVFICTVVFMFIAYLWLAVIVSVISPQVIDIWEAAITLILLPLLVWISYLADIGKFGQFVSGRQIHVYDIERVCELIGAFDRDTRSAIRQCLEMNPALLNRLDRPSSSDLDHITNMVES
jgi:solute carrier family 8 (sodium/calcium exchanger)